MIRKWANAETSTVLDEHQTAAPTSIRRQIQSINSMGSAVDVEHLKTDTSKHVTSPVEKAHIVTYRTPIQP